MLAGYIHACECLFSKVFEHGHTQSVKRNTPTDLYICAVLNSPPPVDELNEILMTHNC